MELRGYLQVIVRRWWIVLPAFVATLAATLALVLPQPPAYESKSTYVVRPRGLTGEDQVRAFDTLIRGQEISGTFASIARSRIVKDRAESRLDPSVNTSEMNVHAEAIVGTNVLTITVSGLDPDAVFEFASAIGQETTDYIDDLELGYELVLLDVPTSPRSPVGSHKPVTIGLGGVLGLLLGVGLAIVADYLLVGPQPWPRSAALAPTADRVQSGIPDATSPDPAAIGHSHAAATEPGAQDLLRDTRWQRFLSEEIASATSANRLFSFGLFRVALPISGGSGHTAASNGHPNLQDNKDLVAVADGLRRFQRDGDMIARIGDRTFAVLWPDMPLIHAESVMTAQEVLIGARRSEDGAGSRIRVSTAVCEYRDGDFTGDELAEQVARTLAHLGQATSVAAEHTPPDRAPGAAKRPASSGRDPSILAPAKSEGF